MLSALSERWYEKMIWCIEQTNMPANLKEMDFLGSHLIGKDKKSLLPSDHERVIRNFVYFQNG
jgi:hypothetical protein